MATRGSIYKRCPHGESGTPGKPACRCKQGSWYWRADAVTTDGKRRQPGKGGFRTRDLAQEALDEHKRAGGTDDQGLTVHAWLEQWLKDSQARVDTGALDADTLRGYRRHVEQVLIPRLGKRRLRDLRRSHVEDMVRALQQPTETPAKVERSQRVKCGQPRQNNDPRPSYQKNNGKPCQKWALPGGDACEEHGGIPQPKPAGPGRGGSRGGSRAPGTIDSYRRTLRAALAAAKRRDLILTNPAEGRLDAMPKRGRSDTKWWQPEEVAAFLESVATDRLAAAYEVAAFAGLRRAELLGLRWKDVDLSGDVPGLYVRQTLSGRAGTFVCPVCGGEHSGRRIKPQPKSDAGVRWVPLVGGTVRELVAHQAAQGTERDQWGDAYSDHELVFAMEDGTPIRPDWFSKQFEAHAAAMELPKIRLHDMRHGAASLLVAAGVPVELATMMLGHASPDVFRRVYAHTLKAPASAGMAAAVALVRDEQRNEDL